MECEGGVMMMNRAEIDTRPPFKSVKEAVALFGHTTVYATNNLKDQIHGGAIGNGSSRLGSVTAELEETKNNLEKAREESLLMANCLCSLKEELETTKKELQLMKEREIEKLMMEFEIEDFKIVPGSARYELNKTKTVFDEETTTEFQKRRYTSTAIANQPCIRPPQGVGKLERHPSLRKKNKKPLIPLMGGLFFSKKKRTPIIS